MKRIKNPSGVHMNSSGKMVDKYGRELSTDWDEFEKLRDKRVAPAIASTKVKKSPSS